jgi:uncharacterized protein (TIGR02594 family)
MTAPLWLSVARMLIGLSEVPGAVNNPVILQWAKDIGAPGWYDNDEKPWCSVFLNRLMLACQLPMSGTGFELLRAKSFETWGQGLTVPSFGCVVTFQRPEGGHVGLYLGETAAAYRVLGGNQGNAVSLTWITKDRLTAMRWPGAVPVTHVGHVLLDHVSGAVSTNEQ